MKYIKSYENVFLIPEYAKIGDYIILNNYENSFFKDNDILNIWGTFLRTKIGIIKEIYRTMTNDKQITVTYEPKDVPRELQNTYLDLTDGKFQRTFDYDSIENLFTCANSLEKLQIKLVQNKYNL
jgi:hypothetical protein